jgi:peptidoglycan/LPS O-acetylase OafA/YrhL
MSVQGSRNAGIDRLRGLAILLVVLHHIGLRIPLRETAMASVLPRRLLSALNYNGYEAVFVFFVISGFLIAGNTLERWGDLARVDLRTFYVRRAARILPCLLALVAMLALLHGFGVDDYVIHRSGQSLSGAAFAALALHLNWYEGETGYLPGNWDVLWSLSIEEAFYLGFPLVCLLTRRRAVLVPLLIVLALSLPFTLAAITDNEIWKEKAYLPGMAAIAAGMLGALWVRSRAPSAGFARMLRWTGGFGLAAVALAMPWLWRTLHDGVMLLLTLATVCLLVGIANRPASTLRGTGWLQSWGRLSYEIYLTHMFVVFAVVRLWRGLGADMRTGAWWYLPAIGLCWLLGRAVARWFSQPCERRLRTTLLRSESPGTSVSM